MKPIRVQLKPAITGLTVPELLVAVVLIAILLALLIPTSQRIVSTVRGSQCISHLRALGNAIALYSTDNNGEMPYGYDSREYKGSYGVILKRYIPHTYPTESTSHPRYCPSTRVNGVAIFKRPANDYYSDYAVNARVFVNSGVYRKRKRVELSSSRTLIAYDGNGRLGSRRLPGDADLPGASGFFATTLAAPRHRDRINVLFLDNHIEVMKEMPFHDVVDPASSSWGSTPLLR